jgi:hypothetical protein
MASDELFRPGVEQFKLVAILRPPSVLRKKSSRQLLNSLIEEVSAFNKRSRVLSLGLMPQATAVVLRPGDSYEAVRELSLEVSRLMAETGHLMGEVEIVRARYDRMMD